MQQHYKDELLCLHVHKILTTENWTELNLVYVHPYPASPQLTAPKSLLILLFLFESLKLIELTHSKSTTHQQLTVDCNRVTL